METLYPDSYLSTQNWFVEETQSAEWTREENKKFESALAMFDEKTPDRWAKVALMIPGKSISDVIKQYRELEEDVSEIEAGRVPIPVYLASSFTFKLVGNRSFDRRKSSTARISDQERKKGVPWTEEEHRQFLLGLLRYGKGDWRSIARKFVKSKTPTQVASHAQKYFIRQLSGGKDKRRPSIHDITTSNLTKTSFSEADQLPLQPHSSQISSHLNSQLLVDWNRSDDGGGFMVFDSSRRNLFVSSSFEITSNDFKREHNLYSTDLYEAYTRSSPFNSMFQIQSSRYQIHGSGSFLR